MRFISANVFGIDAIDKLDYLIARSYDIAFFHETKLTKTAVQFLKLKLGNQYFIEASCADSARRAVVTIIKSSIISQIVRTYICRRGQYVALTVRMSGIIYTLVSVSRGRGPT